MTELEALGQKHGTDKVGHGYLPHYDRLIGDLRNLPITMIEMGVGGGQSLKMWQEWMPKAIVYGFDVNPYDQCFGSRIRTIQGHQGQQHDLENLVKETGNFCFVIDDAGHNLDDEKVAYSYLWPRLLSGGWYVVEDLNGMQNTFDMDAIVGSRNDIDEYHLISNGILFLRKR